jgi:hypothetical protein
VRDARSIAEELARSLNVKAGTHQYHTGLVAQVEAEAAKGSKVERIDTVGHTASGLVKAGDVFALDEKMAARMRPSLTEDVKIVAHGCGCMGKEPFRNAEAFLRALPKNATVYVHDIGSNPGMPVNWVRYRLVDNKLETHVMTGSDKVVGEVLPESYVRSWVSLNWGKDELKRWMKETRMTDDVKAIYQQKLDSKPKHEVDPIIRTNPSTERNH